MTKKDYDKAAKIVKDLYVDAYENADPIGVDDDGFDVIDCRKPLAVETAFIELFQNDNSKFDRDRFVKACRPKGV